MRIRPDVRPSLGPALVLPGFQTVPGSVLLVWNFWKRDCSVTEWFTCLAPNPFECLPLVTQLWVLTLLSLGAWMLLKRPGHPTPIKARLLENGSIDYELPLPLMDLSNPVQISKSSNDHDKEVARFLDNSSFTLVGYQTSREPDCAKAGLVVLDLALVHVFCSYGPVGENSALAASVPLFIVTGPMIVMVSCSESEWTANLKAKIYGFGIATALYGLLLGLVLGNFSGRVS